MSTAAAEKVPPELFPIILGYVTDQAFGNDEQPKEVISLLASCSLVCRYWHESCRAALWNDIKIKSLADLNALKAIISTTPASLKSISRLGYYITAEQCQDDHPWLHNVRTVFPVQERGPCIWDVLLINRPPPKKRLPFNIGPGHPRSLPRSMQSWEQVRVTGVRFDAAHDLGSIFHGWNRQFCSIRYDFENVTWDPQEIKSKSHICEIVYPYKNVSATSCTDNVWVIWQAITTRCMDSRICDGTRARRLDPLVSLPLQKLLEAIGKNAESIALLPWLSSTAKVRYCTIPRHSPTHWHGQFQLYFYREPNPNPPQDWRWSQWLEMVDMDLFSPSVQPSAGGLVDCIIVRIKSLSAASSAPWDWEAALEAMSNFPGIRDVAFVWEKEAEAVQFVQLQKGIFKARRTLVSFWYWKDYPRAVDRLYKALPEGGDVAVKLDTDTIFD